MKKANNLLEELQREEKSGYNLKKDEPAKTTPKKTTESDLSADNYEDDFDEDIEEDIPDDGGSDDPCTKSGNIAGSQGYGITVSQSLGVDPSVDSLALEDYDHVEPVERVS